MPTKLYYNASSPFGYPHISPQTNAPYMPYYTNNPYERLAQQRPQSQQQHQQYLHIPYQNSHQYLNQNAYDRYPFHYNNNHKTSAPYYPDQYLQNNAFQGNNMVFYQNNWLTYQQFALLQAQYYNLNYSNQYYNSAYNNNNNNNNISHQQNIKPNKVDPQPAKEVYHKIPEFKTVRKRLPSPWSKQEKPKFALEKMRSKSAMPSLNNRLTAETSKLNNNTSLDSSTKIIELKEIRKKLEKLEEISSKDTEEEKQQKLEILKKLKSKNNDDNFNVYINSFPFSEDKTKKANMKTENSDESGLGDIYNKSKSSSRFSQTESDSSARVSDSDTPSSTVNPTMPKPTTPTKTHLPENKVTQIPANTDLMKKNATPSQEPSKFVIKQKFKFLGIFNANPEEYILQYGKELIPSIFSDNKSVNIFI